VNGTETARAGAFQRRIIVFRQCKCIGSPFSHPNQPFSSTSMSSFSFGSHVDNVRLICIICNLSSSAAVPHSFSIHYSQNKKIFLSLMCSGHLIDAFLALFIAQLPHQTLFRIRSFLLLYFSIRPTAHIFLSITISALSKNRSFLWCSVHASAPWSTKVLVRLADIFHCCIRIKVFSSV